MANVNMEEAAKTLRYIRNLEAEIKRLRANVKLYLAAARHLNEVRLGLTLPGTDRWYETQYPWLHTEAGDE